MAHILGRNISNNKNVIYGLSQLYGIGLKKAHFICKKIGISTTCSIGSLVETDIIKLTTYIQENVSVENLLRREIASNIKDLIAIRSYRGIRHSLSLPVRGQRTSCNAKTQKLLANARFK